MEYISSLKQLKSSAILPQSPERCTDLLTTSKHPESHSPCLYLISQQSWEHGTHVQKHLLCLLLFQESVSVQKPLPTAFHSCGASGCAKEWPGLSPLPHILCICDSMSKHTRAAACMEAVTGIWKLVWVNFTPITWPISNPLQLQFQSFSAFFCLFFCGFSLIFP